MQHDNIGKHNNISASSPSGQSEGQSETRGSQALVIHWVCVGGRGHTQVLPSRVMITLRKYSEPDGEKM